MYPPHVVEKLSSDLGDIADHHPSVSVLMCDIVGFTDWCSHTPPNRVIECLSAYFQILDDLAEKCGIYKVRRRTPHGRARRAAPRRAGGRTRRRARR